MKFKELMILLNDLNSDLEYLRLKVFDLKVSNSLNQADRNRLDAIDEINRNITIKALLLNGLAMNYVLKKKDREDKKGVSE